MEQWDDIHYVDRVLSGDVSAFNHLVDRHKDLVYNIVLRIVKNREDAEEISQDVFVNAYRSLNKFRKASRFSTWLYRIAYNAAVSATRKYRTEVSPIDERVIERFSVDDVQQGMAMAEEEEKIRMVNAAIERLAEEDGLIMTLFYREEKSIEEISEIMGYSQSNVKVRLHRTRKRIYEELRHQLGG